MTLEFSDPDRGKNHPSVTVVIPTRGRPELSRRAVESALAQTFQNLEVIVVVDGPDESTQRALAEVRDVRLRVLNLPVRAGGSRARNHGVQAAKGEWVAFLDDDDEWLSDKLEIQMEWISRLADPASAVVSCQVWRRNRDSQDIVPERVYDERQTVSEFLFCREKLHDFRCVQTSTLLASKQLCLSLPFTPDLKMHQDYDFVLRAVEGKGAKLLMVPRPLAVWRHDHAYAHVGCGRDWKFSLQWMTTNIALFSPAARTAFMLTVVSPPCWSAALWRTLFSSPLTPGAPRPLWIAMYCVKTMKSAFSAAASYSRQAWYFLARHLANVKRATERGVGL